MTTTAVALDVTTAYAEAVASGAQLTSRKVRLACERHLRDLGHAGDRGLWFDTEAAQDAIDFFGFLQLGEGEHAGRPFELEPWQCFIVGCLMGWKGDDGYRRFRTAYIEIAKGNGKSPMAAGLGLYMLAADGEQGAEVYSAAVTKEQANISFRDARLMAEASTALTKRLQVLERNIAYAKTNSFMRPVSSEHRGLDGKRVFCAIIDEIHEHPSSLVVDKMSAGTKGRRSPLIVEITNSGYDRQSVCFQHHQLSTRILEGALENDSWFAFITGLDPCGDCLTAGHDMPQEGCDECDDWRNEAVWVKANPNIEVSITLKYLRQQVAEAIGMPAKQNIVKRLNFCIWTQSVTRWLPADDVSACAQEPTCEGRPFFCYDLSNTTDLTAVGLVFPPNADGFVDVRARYYVPEENIAERSKRDGVPYDVWVREGWIHPTPGNVVDYGVIREELREDGGWLQEYEIQEAAGDKWNATQFQTWLMEDGLTVVAIPQGFLSLTSPSKALEVLVRKHKVRFGADPVMLWAMSNVVVEMDPAGNIKPSKAKSTERIDPVAMLVNGLSRIALPAEVENTWNGILLGVPNE